MELGTELPLYIIPTTWGSCRPPEFSGRTQDYVTCSLRSTPSIENLVATAYTIKRCPCGCVLRTQCFQPAHTRVILSTAKSLGYPLKIHADEFENIGGAALAAELGAVSATIW